MRRSLFPLFVVCLLCAFSVSAQRADEAGSKIVLSENSGEILLALDQTSLDFDGSVSVEVLGINDEVLSGRRQKVAFRHGRREIIRFQMSNEELFASGNGSVAFYRLRYRVGDTVGIIAFSSLINELFELRVVSAGNIFAGMTHRSRVVAVNPFTGIPLGGVRVKADLSLDLRGEEDKKLQVSASRETDADGTALFDFTIPPTAELDDEGMLKIEGRKNGVVRNVSSEMNVEAEDLQLLMMIDKPIYQPEQAVNIRGVLLKGRDMVTVIPGRMIEFQIEDEDNTVLYRENVTTSEFGVASIAWNIPANIKLGKFSIEAEVEGDRVGYESFRVSRYDLPNFVVSAKTDKLYYLPNEKNAEVEVRADYLFGRQVTKGRVRVVREMDREWNWKEQKYDIDEGEAREGETDSEGVFMAKFNLADDHEELKDDDDFRGQKFQDLRFAAYYTDLTTNRTEQRRFDIRISREPIHVYFNGESYGVNPLLPIETYVTAFYPDGTPAVADVEIKASEEDEDKFRTIARVRTNSLGIAKSVIKRPNFNDDTADMDLRIIARDARGRRGRTSDDINFEFDEVALAIQSERSIYKPGESISVKVLSTRKTGRVFVDVVRGWTVIKSLAAELNDGLAEIAVPYDDNFKGVLTVGAYIEEEDGDLVAASRGVVYPTHENLQVRAETEKAVYKPGEDAQLGFSVVDAGGAAARSALGVVIRDRAVDERATTDSAFGGSFSGYAGWLGYGRSLGAINIKDIKDLDLTKPIPPELDVVASAILYDSYYEPEIARSIDYHSEAATVFSFYFRRHFARIEKALEDYYLKHDFRHPVDSGSLDEILRARGILFNELTDPWGMNYRAEFRVEKEMDVVRIFTNGPDKQAGTDDDFVVSTSKFLYFTPMGLAIDRAIWTHRQETGDVIRDEKNLFRRMGVSGLIDRFGRPYIVKCGINRRMLTTKIISAGPDGREAKYENYGDDFTVWTNRTDYFARTEEAISRLMQQAATKPGTIDEFSAILANGGIKVESILDGWGSGIYVTTREYSRFSDRVRMESQKRYGEANPTTRTIVTPINQQVVVFMLRSPGEDKKAGTDDDFTLAEFQTVVAEQSKDDLKPVLKPISFTGSTGGVAGRVSDPLGAAVPGAKVTATNETTNQSRGTTTDSEGRYMIISLPSGVYTVKIEAAGFMHSMSLGIPVSAGNTTRIDFLLEVGVVSETVDVTASAGESVDASSSSISNNVNRIEVLPLPKNGRKIMELLALQSGVAEAEKKNSTPRLREYFPETLLWNPELITGPDGRAKLDFKLPDNITTWKMYAVATTKDGKVGLTDKDITAFQSFFVNLDPPKFLTEGDEISLPVQVRNYTDTTRKVDVRMDRGEWFSFLGADNGTINVASGETRNAIFGFKALRPVKGGKQRVTALAGDESDAIEKPVTVFPNGQEIARTDSILFDGVGRFNLEFPENTLPGTRHAEVKIYPNLRAHVVEAVEGLLKRPYGCGEQTVSSTYPNLMILRFESADAPIRLKALHNLQKGYERLIGYQMPDGGISYWGGRDASDLALTAYSIRFFKDAADFLAVDPRVVERAEQWLIGRQRADGSWYTRYDWGKSEDLQRSKILTTYVARALAMTKKSSGKNSTAVESALARALDYLRQRNEEIDEPYSIALFGLASLDAGSLGDANAAADRLVKMAIDEGGASYWKLEANTPFHGWGSAGRIETTALVTQLFARLAGLTANGGENNNREGLENLVSRGVLFLLKNKDRYGVWHSTQTTINVLDAFLSTIHESPADSPAAAAEFSIRINGQSVETLTAAADRIEPLSVDISGMLNPQKNTVEVSVPEGQPVMAQIVSNHYIDWSTVDVSGRNVNRSRAL